MAVDDRLTSAALSRAKTHVYNVTQLGLTITLVGALTKDEMGGILTERTLNLKAFPIRFQPFDRITTQKISFAEDSEVLMYVSKKQIDDLGYSIQDLKRKYIKVRYNGITYDMRYFEPYSAFGTEFLYYVIGGKE